MNLTIEINSLPKTIQNSIVEQILYRTPTTYKFLTEDEINKICTTSNINYPNANKVIVSIKSTTISQHLVYESQNIEKKLPVIVNDYNNNLNIVSISVEHDYSPLNLMRLIVEQKYSIKLQRAIKSNVLTEYDLIQLATALNNDNYAVFDMSEPEKLANEFEKKIQLKLDHLGVKYLTQKELVNEQLINFGRRISTPDFQILSDLYINGQKINWIDAKNFFGIDNSLNNKKIKKQTQKYINGFGTGLIIFSLGFTDTLKIDGVLFSDFNGFQNAKIIDINQLANYDTK